MNKGNFAVLAESARLDIESDPAYNLCLGLRQSIWAIFGPRGRGAQVHITLPHASRIKLAVACVVHVRPIWDAKFAGETLVNDALGALEDIVTGSLSYARGTTTFDDLWARALRLSEEQQAVQVAVGFASVRALGTALFDETFAVADLDPSRPDGSDPEEFDTAYWCATAQAEGLPDDPMSNKEKRQAFWFWWLNESKRILEGMDGTGN
jgi:hypothetical protein